MSPGYLLSVDLGTSHTVAVIQWPDGRTRPLLFDGSPIMPSSIFLDQAGTLHTGRDAEAMAAAEPERYEPNPKQRINDGFILLGERDISVAQAFAGILRRVASAAVESVGSLPATVLTCPAEWGERRRAVLQDAAAAAGYPPVQIVPEPVGAAYYYADRLDHPVEAGQALAVFDFGGGTLDIAVVAPDGAGGFRVVSEGGLADLGGLDVDAALVEHLGATVADSHPEAWKTLQHPSSPVELRDRRTLWKDVRGAKEMLSRSSVAPITIPGVDQAFHLTRAELDQLARPLLARGAGELKRVLTASGYGPHQIAGVFLVGGSSRLPLVAQVLHEQVAIAPTVLEQPELPVSEGAIRAVQTRQRVQSPPQSPPAPTPQPQPSPGQGPATPEAGLSPQQSLPPQTPPPPAGDQTYPIPAAAPRKKGRKWLYAAIAVVAVAAIATPLAFFLLREQYVQRPFVSLETVGDTIAYKSDDVDANDVDVRGDTAYVSYVEDEGGPNDRDVLYLQAIDVTTGKVLWETDDNLEACNWYNITAGDDMILSRRTVPESDDCSDTDYEWRFVDASTGDLRTAVTTDRYGKRLNDNILSIREGKLSFSIYDESGKEFYAFQASPGAKSLNDYGYALDDGYVEGQPYTDQNNGRVWWTTVQDDGSETFHLYDVEERTMVTEGKIGKPYDYYLVFNDKVFVGSNDNGYTLDVYESDDLSSVDTAQIDDPGVQGMLGLVVCGKTRVCVLESRNDDSSVGESFRVYDFEAEEWVYSSDDEFQMIFQITAVGNRVLLSQDMNSDGYTVVLDEQFEQIGRSDGTPYRPIDNASAIKYPYRSNADDSDNAGSIIGLGVQDGSSTVIAEDFTHWGCDVSDVNLVCLHEEGIQVYRFRDGPSRY
ncbi:Hsp70 family protein [Haloglycomyces albus]|uniref:Hsp70 family protein n=1 Tax=Haloglycomyces albus TaxID=526067 RepID=UPI00046D0B37|nr:Hsp70 family protein [Haloglycomyces albus]